MDPGTAQEQPVGGGASGGTAPAPTPPTRHPRTHEVAAWRSFLRAHASVVRRLEADLLRVHGLSLGVYDVLVQLVEAPERRLRMTELADAVLLSRSGLTRLVDRMVRDGYVIREPDPGDARGVWAVLTPAGFDRLRTASSTHLDGVGRYVVDPLDPAELTAWGNACAKIAGADLPAPPQLSP
ncbi:MarR family winged helix-turn-helix transcriptional regulator [Angustibacter sp. McL0619]|uniref:MarR family winged helix-turn-helix transcriptional regulator n=1 Tax=Angustibacter sp. McL0619 TaxID=3415676 RepID=UPI003CF8F6B8